MADTSATEAFCVGSIPTLPLSLCLPPLSPPPLTLGGWYRAWTIPHLEIGGRDAFHLAPDKNSWMKRALSGERESRRESVCVLVSFVFIEPLFTVRCLHPSILTYTALCYCNCYEKLDRYSNISNVSIKLLRTWKNLVDCLWNSLISGQISSTGHCTECERKEMEDNDRKWGRPTKVIQLVHDIPIVREKTQNHTNNFYFPYLNF